MDIEDILALSEDDELAFIEYEKQLRLVRDEQIAVSNTIGEEKEIKLDYVTQLLAYHDACEFDFLKDPLISPTAGNFDYGYDGFIRKVQYYITVIKVKHARRQKAVTLIVTLTVENKEELHKLTKKIRSILLPLDLPPSKKEALLRRLKALELEIDFDRTNTQSWAAWAIEVAAASGEVAKELRPVKELTDAMSTVFGKAKEFTEILRLKAPETIKLLKGPESKVE